MVSKHEHSERHWGVLPLDQVPPLAAIANNPNDAYPGSVGGNPLHDLPDGVDPQDPATVAQLGDSTVTAYRALGLLQVADAGCQVIGNWIGMSGATLSVQAAAGGSYTTPDDSPGPNSIRIRTTADAQGGYINAVAPGAQLKAGRRYAEICAVKVIDDPGVGNVFRFYMQFSLSGSQRFLDFSPAPGYTPINEWVYLIDYYVATADGAPTSGSPFVRDIGGSGGLDPGGTADLYVGFDQIVEMPNPLTGFLRQIDASTWMAATDAGWEIQATDGSAHIRFDRSYARIRVANDTIGDEWVAGQRYRKVEHTPSDLAELGYADDVGDDYLTVWLSQKDATTVQRYAAVDVDTEHVDRGAGRQKTRGALGNVAFQDLLPGTLNFMVDGGGSVITNGIKGDIHLDFAGSFTVVTLLADQVGDIELDIWKDVYANFPPTVADSIVAAAPPAIVAAIKSQDATLTGWTVAFAAGDVLRFSVTSCTAITRATLSLKFVRS